jgi:hypothetical protein
MSSAISTAVNGLNNAVTRIANATSNIVNASSKSSKIDLNADVISSKIAQTDYAANAAVIKTAEKNQKALLDIKT